MARASTAAPHLRLVPLAPEPAAPAAGSRAEPLTAQAQLFPEAYQHTVSGGERDLLPALRRWFVVLGLTFVLLFVVSAPLWWNAVEGLSHAVDRALSPGGVSSSAAPAP